MRSRCEGVVEIRSGKVLVPGNDPSASTAPRTTTSWTRHGPHLDQTGCRELGSHVTDEEYGRELQRTPNIALSFTTPISWTRIRSNMRRTRG